MADPALEYLTSMAKRVGSPFDKLKGHLSESDRTTLQAGRGHPFDVYKPMIQEDGTTKRQLVRAVIKRDDDGEEYMEYIRDPDGEMKQVRQKEFNSRELELLKLATKSTRSSASSADRKLMVQKMREFMRGNESGGRVLTYADAAKE